MNDRVAAALVALGCFLLLFGAAARGAPAGLPADPSWVINGPEAHARLGADVAGAGDVNGDGIDDLMVSVGGRTATGWPLPRVLVFHGAPCTGPSLVPDWSVVTGGRIANGGSVASAGDVNGDGYDDVIIGTISYDTGSADDGRASVFVGSAAGLAAAPAWTVTQRDTFFGWDVASAGDVNGDGYDDVVVGASLAHGAFPYAGKAFVYLGSPAGPSPSPDWSVEGECWGCRLGSAVAGAGDVDADGYDDVIVAADAHDGSIDDEGRIYLFRGGPSGPESSPSWISDGGPGHWDHGRAIAGAGDVNGDGHADVVVSALAVGSLTEARVQLYLGSRCGLSMTADWTAHGSGGLGFALDSAGDVNGDGLDDVVVGSQSGDRADVVLGARSGLAATWAWTILSDQPTSLLGGTVAGAGDVDGNGLHDVIVGAPGFSFGSEDTGAAQLYLSGPGGSLPPSAGVVSCLWPPRHQLECFTSEEIASLLPGSPDPASFRFVDCTSSQPDDAVGSGDGATTGDCVVSDDGRTLCARAERAGADRAGRTYSIVVTPSLAPRCGAAAATSIIAQLFVPHAWTPASRCTPPQPAVEADCEGTSSVTGRSGRVARVGRGVRRGR